MPVEKFENAGITLRLYGGILVAVILVALGMHYFG